MSRLPDRRVRHIMRAHGCSCVITIELPGWGNCPAEAGRMTVRHERGCSLGDRNALLEVAGLQIPQIEVTTSPCMR